MPKRSEVWSYKKRKRAKKTNTDVPSSNNNISVPPDTIEELPTVATPRTPDVTNHAVVVKKEHTAPEPPKPPPQPKRTSNSLLPAFGMLEAQKPRDDLDIKVKKEPSMDIKPSFKPLEEDEVEVIAAVKKVKKFKEVRKEETMDINEDIYIVSECTIENEEISNNVPGAIGKNIEEEENFADIEIIDNDVKKEELCDTAPSSPVSPNRYAVEFITTPEELMFRMETEIPSQQSQFVQQPIPIQSNDTIIDDFEQLNSLKDFDFDSEKNYKDMLNFNEIFNSISLALEHFKLTNSVNELECFERVDKSLLVYNHKIKKVASAAVKNLRGPIIPIEQLNDVSVPIIRVDSQSEPSERLQNPNSCVQRPEIFPQPLFVPIIEDTVVSSSAVNEPENRNVNSELPVVIPQPIFAPITEDSVETLVETVPNPPTFFENLQRPVPIFAPIETENKTMLPFDSREISMLLASSDLRRILNTASASQPNLNQSQPNLHQAQPNLHQGQLNLTQLQQSINQLLPNLNLSNANQATQNLHSELPNGNIKDSMPPMKITDHKRKRSLTDSDYTESINSPANLNNSAQIFNPDPRTSRTNNLDMSNKIPRNDVSSHTTTERNIRFTEKDTENFLNQISGSQFSNRSVSQQTRREPPNQSEADGKKKINLEAYRDRIKSNGNARVPKSQACEGEQRLSARGEGIRPSRVEDTPRLSAREKDQIPSGIVRDPRLKPVLLNNISSMQQISSPEIDPLSFTNSNISPLNQSSKDTPVSWGIPVRATNFERAIPNTPIRYPGYNVSNVPSRIQSQERLSTNPLGNGRPIQVLGRRKSSESSARNNFIPIASPHELLPNATNEMILNLPSENGYCQEIQTVGYSLRQPEQVGNNSASNSPSSYSRENGFTKPLIPTPPLKNIPVNTRGTLLTKPKIGENSRASLNNNLYPDVNGYNQQVFFATQSESCVPVHVPRDINRPHQEVIHQRVPSMINNAIPHREIPRSVSLISKSSKEDVGRNFVPSSFVYLLIIEWSIDWFTEFEMTGEPYNNPPPIIPAEIQFSQVRNTYKDKIDYYNTYFKLLLAETWFRLYSAFKELTRLHDPRDERPPANQTFQAKIVEFEAKNEFNKYVAEFFVYAADFEQVFRDSCVIFLQFVTSDRKPVRMLGYVTQVAHRSFNPPWDVNNEAYSVLRNVKNKRVLKYKISFYTVFKADDIDSKQLVSIQKLASIRKVLTQNDALINVHISPLSPTVISPITAREKFYTYIPEVTQEYFVEIEKLCSRLLDTDPLLALIHSECSRAERMSTMSHLIDRVKVTEPDYKVIICSKLERNLHGIALDLKEHNPIYVSNNKVGGLTDYTVNHLAEQYKPADNSENWDTLKEMAIAKVFKKCHVILLLLLGRNEEIPKLVTEHKVSCVILDEAHNCSEPESIIPLTYGVKKFVLLGNKNLLCDVSPLTNSYDYNRSLFNRASL